MRIVRHSKSLMNRQGLASYTNYGLSECGAIRQDSQIGQEQTPDEFIDQL